MLRIRFIIALTVLLSNTCFSQTLPLPARATNAISSADFISQIKSLTLAEREQAITSQILTGNVPASLPHLCAVNLTNVANGKTNIATLFITRDYLSIGTDSDYFLAPMTPATAQHIADELGCTLPTRKMVDAIYAAAEIKLTPQPITPNAAMTTIPVFATHNEIIRTQLVALGKSSSATELLAGHKKDVVISAKLAALTNRVAIYGWHQTNGLPIQPLYIGHRGDWADYSHGIRLVQQRMIVNGTTTTLARVLADPELSGLLSDEGIITNSRYATNISTTAVLTNQTFFGERITTLSPAPEMKVEINSPPAKDFAPDKPVLLVLFALPNGNTTAQTIGRKLQAGDDWHFDIQHIGAQTRFLRAAITNRTIVIAYLEAEMKSWPAWRKKHGNTAIPGIVAAIRQQFPTSKLELVITGHSGGGSFTFGYLNAVTNIPADVKRIAFLDSNYAYETTNHLDKLTRWLKSSDETKLCVLAYHDSIALLDGKTFVSERVGTWGRSHAMLEDLRAEFPFTNSTNSASLQSHVAARGKIQLLLKENPEKKILHTVQVERNGFIHAMLTGTPLENVGYDYFGERTYEKWVQPR